MPVEYKATNVLEAARARVSGVFDDFERVVISVSGGKDSTVLRHLALAEADRRGRRCSLFFLDQEAEYQSTIDVIGEWMRDPRVDPEWYQVPIRMTNATSHRDYWLYAWGPGEEWIRPKDERAIHAIDGEYPQRFHDFFEWHEARAEPGTAYLVGLRSNESFNRFRAVTKRAAHRDWTWTTRTKARGVVRAYPLYDWMFGDVWKYVVEQELPYNRLYDRLFALHGTNVSRMRVSNLIHEHSFRCLADLQEIEPDTYERLVRRLGGVHCAALYARGGHVYDAKALPVDFGSWRAYRDHLLDTTPIDRVARFRDRFAGQSDDERTARQQVRQILINDWENSVPVARPQQDRLRARWWDVL